MLVQWRLDQQQMEPLVGRASAHCLHAFILQGMTPRGSGMISPLTSCPRPTRCNCSVWLQPHVQIYNYTCTQHPVGPGIARIAGSRKHKAPDFILQSCPQWQARARQTSASCCCPQALRRTVSAASLCSRSAQSATNPLRYIVCAVLRPVLLMQLLYVL
jgi:hypothetical protein